jgi:hypothetical protein
MQLETMMQQQGEKIKRRIEDKLLITTAWKFMPLSILRFQSGELFVYT